MCDVMPHEKPRRRYSGSIETWFTLQNHGTGTEKGKTMPPVPTEKELLICNRQLRQMLKPGPSQYFLQ